MERIGVRYTVDIEDWLIRVLVLFLCDEYSGGNEAESFDSSARMLRMPTGKVDSCTMEFNLFGWAKLEQMSLGLYGIINRASAFPLGGNEDC